MLLIGRSVSTIDGEETCWLVLTRADVTQETTIRVPEPSNAKTLMLQIYSSTVHLLLRQRVCVWLCVCVWFWHTCRSFCGFQSESKMMQVSAAVRLIPRPPALVHRRKTNRSDSGLLKRSMAACRRFPRTRPSIRSYKYLQDKNK